MRTNGPSPKGNLGDTLSGDVYHEIRQRICLCDYRPGTMLSENALASDFAISRAGVRKALQRLEYEGLVESIHGVGTIVTTVDLKTLREVYAFRIKLAEFMSEQPCMTHVSEDDIVRLDELWRQCTALRERYDPRELARVNMLFHDLVTGFITNKYLRETVDRLYYLTARGWMGILPEMGWLEEVNFIAEEIEQTLLAVRNRDMAAVGKVRRDHLTWFFGRVIRYLGGAAGPGIGAGDVFPAVLARPVESSEGR